MKQIIEWKQGRKLSVDKLTKRKIYDSAIFHRLVEDIKDNGFKEEHPLVVRPDPKKTGYWKITCGQHRFEAGQQAGVARFPCIIRSYQRDPVIAIREALLDNTLRCEPDPITEAQYFKKMGLSILKQMGYSDEKIKSLKRKMPIERISREVNLSVGIVKRRLSLLRLPNIAQHMIGRFSVKNARGMKLPVSIGEELVYAYENIKMQKVKNPDKKLNRLAYKCYREKLRVKEVRHIVSEIARLGYNTWKNKKIVIDENGIRCAICGGKAVQEDVPWLPFCLDHKADILTDYKKREYDKELGRVMKKHGKQITQKESPEIKLVSADCRGCSYVGDLDFCENNCKQEQAKMMRIEASKVKGVLDGS